MSYAKAVFITSLVEIMLVLIIAGLYMLYPKAFSIAVAILACYGFARGTGDFLRWVQKEPPEPKHLETVQNEDPFAHDDEFAVEDGTPAD